MGKKDLVDMPSNREYSSFWPWEDPGTISNKLTSPYHIRQESGRKNWEYRVFRLPKNDIAVEMGIIQERVHQGLFEPVWGPNWNAHILVPKNIKKYGFIISARVWNW